MSKVSSVGRDSALVIAVAVEQLPQSFNMRGGSVRAVLRLHALRDAALYRVSISRNISLYIPCKRDLKYGG